MFEYFSVLVSQIDMLELKPIFYFFLPVGLLFVGNSKD